MWGYLIGICVIVNGEQLCEDQTFVPNFTSQTACEVHSILQTSIINYELRHIDGIYDMWVAPTNCINIPIRPSVDQIKPIKIK